MLYVCFKGCIPIAFFYVLDEAEFYCTHGGDCYHYKAIEEEELFSFCQRYVKKLEKKYLN